MGLILDTSILIAAEKRQLDLSALTHGWRVDEIAIPTIVVSELLHGWERAPSGRRKDERRAFIDEILLQTFVVPFGFDEALIHAHVSAVLATAGIAIGLHDLIIAATCLRLDWDLATLNRAEFSRVPGLRLVPTDAGRIGD